jgi:hypothetical protein
MDLYSDALEGMATRFEGISVSTEPDEETVKRWRHLFHLPDPYSTIVEHRSALDPGSVSAEHWNLVRIDKEAEGHDQESYEYSLALRPQRPRTNKSTPIRCDRSQYLLQLLPSCPPIASLEAI